MQGLRSSIGLLGIRPLLLILVLSCTLPLTGALIFVAVETRRAMAEHAVATLKTGLERAGVALEAQVNRMKDVLVQLSRDARVDPLNLSDCTAPLSQVRLQIPILDSLFLAEIGGRVVCSAVPLDRSVDLAERDYFKTALENSGVTIGAPALGRASGRPTLPLAAAVRSTGTGPKAVVAAGLDIAGFIGELRAKLELPAATLTVWDERGLVLGRAPDPKMLSGKLLPNAELFRLVAGGAASDGTADGPTLDGVPSIYAFRSVQIGGQTIWLTAHLSASALFGAVDDVFERTIVATVIVTLLSIIFGYLIWDHSVRWPLLAIEEKLRALTLGEAPLNDAPPLVGARELTAIAASLDELARAKDRGLTVPAADRPADHRTERVLRPSI